MYIVVENGTDNYAIIRQKKKLGAYIGVSVGTIRSKDKLTKWEWGAFTVINPKYVDESYGKVGKFG